MQGVIGRFIIILIGISIVHANIHLNATEVTATEENNNTPLPFTRSSEERRWTPQFPKNSQKFIITIKSVIARNFTTPVRSKSPVLKVIPKVVKIKSGGYWKTATTRRSLMKYTKFTINPLTTMLRTNVTSNNRSDNNKHIGKKNETNQINMIETSNESSEEDVSSETSTVSSKVERKQNQNKKYTALFRTVQSKTKETFAQDKSKSIEHNVTSSTDKNSVIDKVKRNYSDLWPEEKEDREEFIFVTPKTVEEHKVVKKDSAESDESTTVFEKELNLRKTRSVNVIEEENLGTTVSGFKFTGKVASLTNQLIFRNINT